jgi:hypothetical protein
MGGDRGGIERKGAQDIVGAMVAAGFIDRKDLHGAEVVPRRPLDHFGEGLRVTDAEVMPAPEGEEWNEKSRDFLFRIDGHGWMLPLTRVGPSGSKGKLGIARKNLGIGDG